MWLKDQYRSALSHFYGHVFSGSCVRLKVSGIVRFINRRQIWIGSDVLLKRECELLPSKELLEKSIIIGNHSEIHEYCVFRTFRGTIVIGEYCSFNRDGIVWGGGVSIGNKVRIGPRVMITTSNHVFSDRERPIMEQGVDCGEIVIADDVWIGTNVTILSGVTIGKGAVVGAGAVVTKDVIPYTVVAGVPAKVIGTR